VFSLSHRRWHGKILLHRSLSRHSATKPVNHFPKSVDLASLNHLDRLQSIESVAGSLEPPTQRVGIDNFGDPNAWYGQWPIRYEHLLELSFADQIGGQIASLREMFEAQFSELPAERVMRLNYASFCASPRDALELIRARVRAAFGSTILPAADPPCRFNVSRHPETTAHYEALVAGLEKHGVPARFGAATVS